MLLEAKCSLWVADMADAKEESDFSKGAVDVADCLPSLL